MSGIFETHFARYPVHRRCFVRFLASTASAAFILKDTNKELGGYVRVGATHNITESKGANCHFTSDISQRKYYGEHIFNSDKSAHIAAMRQKDCRAYAYGEAHKQFRAALVCVRKLGLRSDKGS